MITFYLQKWNQGHFEEDDHSVKYRCLVIQCNATGHSGVSNYYGTYWSDPHARQYFYASVVYECYKIAWHVEYDIWFNSNAWRLLSLGRIEEFLLLENLLKASESDESNEPQQKTKITLTNQSPSYLKKEEENMKKILRLVKQQK